MLLVLFPLWISLASFFCPRCLALQNGLGLLPPMGYNTWNAYHDSIDNKLLFGAAELLVELGLRDAGYRYLVIDDGWAERERNASQPIAYNRTRFPEGIKYLSDTVHKQGLLLGIYSDAGAKTCANYTASLGYEVIDAAAFASWGIDYLKYDNCFAAAGVNDTYDRQRFSKMRDALNATGRPIYYAICEWGVSAPWTYGQEVGNSWRTTQDISLSITADWDRIIGNLDMTAGLGRFAGPGGFNDPDMLEVGWPNAAKLSYSEQRAHFALWALVKAPLIFGTDLRNITAQTLGLLLSKEVIAVNQDPLGVPGDLVWKQGPHEVWAGPLAGGTRAVILFNRQFSKDNVTAQATLRVFWQNVGLPPGTTVVVRDLFRRRDLGYATDSYSAVVRGHDSLVLKLSPVTPNNSLDSWRPWDCSNPPLYGGTLALDRCPGGGAVQQQQQQTNNPPAAPAAQPPVPVVVGLGAPQPAVAVPLPGVSLQMKGVPLDPQPQLGLGPPGIPPPPFSSSTGAVVRQVAATAPPGRRRKLKEASVVQCD